MLRDAAEKENSRSCKLCIDDTVIRQVSRRAASTRAPTIIQLELRRLTPRVQDGRPASMGVASDATDPASER
jgi:hypothetical protein